MNPSRALRLFEGFGVELQYMFVDRETLDIQPIVDHLFRDFSGEVSDVDNGPIAWSNVLMAHIVELKTKGPIADLSGAAQDFHRNIGVINRILYHHGVMLLPGAVHPWMNPLKEMVPWPHNAPKVHALYNTLFDCHSHGWANQQSTHLNLSFAGNEEFARLHSAIRLLLPLLAALTASSPILDGQSTDWLDARLNVYLHNLDRLPVLTGHLIPEAVCSEAEYEEQIMRPIMEAVGPLDPEKIMDRHLLNSRGAIARFDRGTIEIQMLDTQECPLADCSIARLIIEMLRGLVTESWSEFSRQVEVGTQRLHDLFLRVIKTGGDTVVNDPEYLQLFGLKSTALSVSDVWRALFERLAGALDIRSRETLAVVLGQGCLATRIMRALQGDFRHDNLRNVYRELAKSLRTNKLFLP